MSNQDYISRSPAKKKKKPQKKGKKAQPVATVKTKIVGVLVILLLCGFAYGLWALKNSPETKTPIQNAPEKVTESKKSPDKKANSLPKPPKEKWTYVKDLENKQVEVGEYEVEQGGPYKMQCGSFKTQKQAEVLKANIAFAGLEAIIQPSTGKNGTWYKVALGPYPRKRMAEKDKNKLKRNNINHCQIWLWK
ncbi:SPOR domain-containing protein [Litorilituus lipolyticus]|uniref:Cell division protein FtsN n=1 Tax=Litorilituus lipolyticus TaxID=2491017 RepID=A0A502L3G0_9GAMM|nr:SPOR domain-containing protein [Litorilituus lipolyticus]TPH17734.1 cell division protein FtsN [Litorilituus lipolyticus]